ncbi:MAG: hypothetical protein HC925_08545 [Coleofasciculaceae cyanobacterium SM2_3_26]|nr:hypothetical protein [Coleofasciculaceae cyanobacterium SM2_3_26]
MQVVDFVLRKLLTSEQLPRKILWADGVRAFNSGRPDRTFAAIQTSVGYEMLAAGVRPPLNPSPSPAAGDCPEVDSNDAGGDNVAPASWRATG